MDHQTEKLKLLINLTDEDIKVYQAKFPHLNSYTIHVEGQKACDWALEHTVYDVEGFFFRWLKRVEDRKIRFIKIY